MVSKFLFRQLAINKLPILRRSFVCLFCYKNRRVVALHNYFCGKEDTRRTKEPVRWVVYLLRVTLRW